jgi:hypothetical protein
MNRSRFAASFLFALLLTAITISGTTLLRPQTPKGELPTQGCFLQPTHITAKGIVPETYTGSRTVFAGGNQLTQLPVGAAAVSFVQAALPLPAGSRWLTPLLPVAENGLYLTIRVLRI